MTEKLQKELNVQINAEMWSSNLYLSMAFLQKRTPKKAKNSKIEHLF